MAKVAIMFFQAQIRICWKGQRLVGRLRAAPTATTALLIAIYHTIGILYNFNIFWYCECVCVCMLTYRQTQCVYCCCCCLKEGQEIWKIKV